MPPHDKKDAEWEGARTRFSPVLDATDLPVAIYQVGYSSETLTRLAQLPPVFAIKEGSGDPVAFERNMRSVRALGRGIAVWSTHAGGCWPVSPSAPMAFCPAWGASRRICKSRWRKPCGVRTWLPPGRSTTACLPSLTSSIVQEAIPTRG